MRPSREYIISKQQKWQYAETRQTCACSDFTQDVLSDSTVEELLRGMASQIAEWEGTVLCSDVRDKLSGPMEFSRRDLGALNIMRGQDDGLPDYNTVRYLFFLQILVDFTLYIWAQIAQSG
jgi:hypothetical protein